MKTILLIFLGGGLGSIVRYAVGNWISRLVQDPFPAGTLVVNVVACLLVGLLAGVAGQGPTPSTTKAFLVIGFCGGFSTFSTFTSESALLFNGNMTGSAVAYVTFSVIGCLGATILGLWLAGKA